jgi:hypothetical protein
MDTHQNEIIPEGSSPVGSALPLCEKVSGIAKKHLFLCWLN